MGMLGGGGGKGGVGEGTYEAGVLQACRYFGGETAHDLDIGSGGGGGGGGSISCGGLCLCHVVCLCMLSEKRRGALFMSF